MFSLFSKKELHALKVKYSALDREYMHYKQDMAATESKLLQENKTLQQRVTQLEHNSQNYQHELAQVKQELAALKSELIEKQQENKSLKGQLGILETEVADTSDLATENHFTKACLNK